MALMVQRWNYGYAVFDGKDRLSGAFSNRDVALRALDRIEAERRVETQSKNRPCLCCRTVFWSTGPGHRMCDNCRAHSSGLGRQMVG